ncbi:MAG: type II toxin-antitoxin system VapC family toxin [Candidatus Caldarchaeum sp.]|uniref:PIN domain-containing protein n=1 Tax=Caldiarchaeum subterraneum TaxID=311458 RepID=A0A7C5U490_CALS0
MKHRLFDASALINCVWLGKAAELVGHYSVELVKFEVGNYVWKRRDSMRHEDCLTVFEKLQALIALMKTAPVNFSDALSLAISENITFCDAVYLQAAVQNGLDLVTDDSKLFETAKKYVRVLRSEEL